MIGRTVSHYEIIEEIDGGGMGVVYKALDTKLNVHRALKFIHPHLVSDERIKQRFILEAQAASSLDHPNICAIHQVDETPNGRPFICMTYYEGVTLAERRQEAPLPVLEVFQIGLAIARGLKCAHDKGITHRDIKPGNIMIPAEGYLKILDFGLAKLTGAPDLTRTDTAMGTVRYMSPEQINARPADQRSDIWSLGLVMYELATGVYPFKGDYDPAVAYAITHTDQQPMHEVEPRVPKTLSRVIERCLAKDPEERYASADELIAALAEVSRAEAWEGSLAGLATPITQANGVTNGAGGPPWRRVLMAAAVLAVAVTALIWWRTQPPPLFTTEMRVAVMPLENRAHPSHDLVAGGLTVVTSRLLDEAAQLHDSMWVVPDRLVKYAEVTRNDAAKDAFGVNHIVTGGLQRYEGGVVLRLILRDADSLEQIGTAQVPFDPESTVLADSLPGAVLALIDLDPRDARRLPRHLPAKADAVYEFLQGVGAMRAGNPTEAMSSLAEAADADSDFPLAWSALGWAQWNRYETTAADSLLAAARWNLEKAVALAPDRWWSLVKLGDVLRWTGNPAEALAALEAANELNPEEPLVARGLSDTYFDVERFAESEAILKALIARSPDYFEAQRLLAVHYYWMGEEEAALSQLDRVLALAPADEFSLNTKGGIYFGRGDFTAARKYFEAAFAALPNCDTSSNIGAMLYYAGQYRESASYYELSLEFCGENDSEAWGNWGRSLYWTEGGRAEAGDKLRNAIALARSRWERDPGDLVLLGHLIEYNALVGDEIVTRRLIATADSLQAQDAELCYQIGGAYELIGDRNAALRHLTESVRHGMPVERIQDTRELANLVNDPRFARLMATAAGTMEEQVESTQ